MFVWMIAGAQGTKATDCGSLDQSTCQAATNVGTGIGVTLLFFLWFIGFIVFSLIWLMSRPDRRLCPVCGEQVKKGLTVCPKCGYNFATAVSQVAAVQGPQCWRCHAPIAVGQSPCPKCGAPIGW